MSRQSNRNASTAFEFAAIHILGVVLLLALLVPATFPSLSKFEGRVWPVARAAEIVDLRGDGANGSYIRFKFTVSRACEFKHIVWSRILEDGTLEAVPVDFGKPLGSRGSGTHMSQEWHVGMPPGDIRGHSIAYVWHDCHPGWPVISQFYP